MLNTMFTNWSFIRAIRLILGIIVISQAIFTKNYLFVIPGVLFTGMALFNTGCCGSNGCAIPKSKKQGYGKE
ncbi:MAG: hypothetical protein PHW29_02000 [Flavobacterium sp.]|uniref:DUF2892 domain-containing protein n=2 Tax=Flavobacterium TaxID=237 RepID=A0A4R5AWS0_9FLAO|nr:MULTISPECIES: hypothetical protein [Flavobacterium]MDD2820014.1 hypothetical protein [Flavobacterium sp.]TDD77273.1 hypothetical protein E0F89_06710 [Flavobacterium caseinilyticum]